MYGNIASQHSSFHIGLHHHRHNCVGSRAGLEQHFIIRCDHIRSKSRPIVVIYATLHSHVRLSVICNCRQPTDYNKLHNRE